MIFLANIDNKIYEIRAKTLRCAYNIVKKYVASHGGKMHWIDVNRKVEKE